MALLGSFIDSRTTTAVVSGSSASFAHGCPANPDIVWTEPIASLASSTNWYHVYGLHDATNVTLHNDGGANGPSQRVVSAVLHSIIR